MASVGISTAAPLPRALYTFGTPWPQLNEGLSYSDVVPSSCAAPTLIEFYSSKYKSSAPAEGWLQRIRNGQITIEGQVVTCPETILREGSRLVYHRLPWREPDAPYLLDVLYEDDEIVVIDKPSGLQVLPGGLFQQRTVLKQLEWKSSEGYSSSSYCDEPVSRKSHPVPVHRLGRGTSGVLLCAKTKRAKAFLAASFANETSIAGDRRKYNSKLDNAKKILKFYRAIVTGLLENDEILINQPIGIVQYPVVAKGLYAACSYGKPALSKVNVLERDTVGNKSLVQVEIYSGRPHQIRIHLAFIGHPLVGDPLYGVGGHPKFMDSMTTDEYSAEDGGYQRPARPVPGDCGYYLHAHQLALHHPSTNEVVEVTAPLPPILKTREELNKA